MFKRKNILDIRDTTGRLVFRFEGASATRMIGLIIPHAIERQVVNPEKNTKYYRFNEDKKMIVEWLGVGGEITLFFVKGYCLEISKK